MCRLCVCGLCVWAVLCGLCAWAVCVWPVCVSGVCVCVCVWCVSVCVGVSRLDGLGCDVVVVQFVARVFAMIVVVPLK